MFFCLHSRLLVVKTFAVAVSKPLVIFSLRFAASVEAIRVVTIKREEAAAAAAYLNTTLRRSKAKRL